MLIRETLSLVSAPFNRGVGGIYPIELLTEQNSRCNDVLVAPKVTWCLCTPASVTITLCQMWTSIPRTTLSPSVRLETVIQRRSIIMTQKVSDSQARSLKLVATIGICSRCSIMELEVFSDVVNFHY